MYFELFFNNVISDSYNSFMKINVHPERMLESILRGNIDTFSNAKRMIKELSIIML